jgi:hypothetical protein
MILLDMAVKVLSLPLYHKISFNKRTKKIIIREEEKVGEHFCQCPESEKQRVKENSFKARNHLLNLLN